MKKNLKYYFSKTQTLISLLFPNSLFEDKCAKLESEIEDLLCVVNKKGRVKFFSTTAIKILGYNINTKLQSIFFEMYGTFILELFNEENDIKQNPSYIEFPIKNAQGKYIWLRLNFVLIKNDTLITITANDVSKKRDLFEEFDERSIFSKSLVENLKVGILMEDTNRDIIFVNQTLINIFKFDITPGQLMGGKCTESLEIIKDLFMFPDDFKNSTNKIAYNRREVLNEVLLLKDGRVFERSYYPFKNKTESQFSIWMYDDKTEQYLANDIIKESEKKYRGIFENLQFGVVEIDKNGIILHSSSNFCKMIEYTEQQLIGQTIDKFILSACTKNNLSELLNTKKRNDSCNEMQVINSKNEKSWVLVNLSPIFNQYEQLQGGIIFFYDITERKVLEEALKYANLNAKKAEESEKFFLASMTHELKTPINAMLGMSDLLKMTDISNEQKEYIEILETSTTYLQKLVSDILDISKIESGNVEIKKTTFNLLNFLLKIVNTFEYSLSQKNIKLKIDFDFSPNLEVIADRVILQQVLSNLLSNAEKFTLQGSIILSVTYEEETTNEIKLNFKVSDTGIGIDDDMKEIIFEKFKQLPSLQVHKSQGSGLGLNIVKQLLALQNSKIEVKSKKGEGSTFFFDIVFEKAEPSQQIITAKPNLDSNTQFKSINVLVVEDNDLNQRYVAKVLHKWSIDFDMVSSGEDAIIKFEETKYDLILMDLQLPGISGLETAVKLRELQKEYVFTIIAMTAVVTSNIEVEILKNGMNDILRKPFSIADLYEKMQLYFTPDNHQTAKEEIKFHHNLDTIFLKQFYEKDKDYALSVFEYFKYNYFEEFKLIIQNIDKLDLNETKKRLHSIKPAFKMVGLTLVERDIELILSNDFIYLDTIKHFIATLGLI